MPSAAYTRLIGNLFPRLTGGIRWGLERTERMLDALGNPHRRFRSIHVGGTNGKGSVAVTLASVLTHAGYRTGIYTSPHLCSFRERIRINGAPIEETTLVQVAETVWPIIMESGASFFEATTVLAFAALARAEVEVAVVEVGLGGRLDATNVILPELSIITNIALDHAEYLGNTRTAIAREKAGIIKPGVPLVTAESAPEVLDVFQARCSELGAPLHTIRANLPAELSIEGSCFSLETVKWGHLALRTPLIGTHQVTNTALAVSALDLTGSDRDLSRAAVERGLAAVRWPGRFQVIRAQQTWVFDVAHNEAGVLALVDTFWHFEFPQPVALLIGILGDKDWPQMLPPLFELGDHTVLTVPASAPHNRAWDPRRVARELNTPQVIVEPDFARALDRVQELSAPAGTILVTGSFHTVGDALARLGWCEVEPDGA